MREWGARLAVYVLGLAVLSGGSTLAINVNLGLPAVNSFPYALSRALEVSYGTGLMIVFTFFIATQYILLGKHFPVSNVLQLPVTFVYGCFADFWVWMFTDLALEAYPVKLAALFLSIALVGLGVALYVTPHIMPNPAEGLSIAVAKRFNTSFSVAKTVSDSGIVLLALATGLLFLGGVVGVREGTIISALLTGKAAGISFRIVRPLMARLAGTGAFLK